MDAMQWMDDPHLLERRYPRKPNRINDFQGCLLRVARCRPTPPATPGRKASLGLRFPGEGSTVNVGAVEDGLRPSGIRTGTPDCRYSRGVRSRSPGAEHFKLSGRLARLGSGSRGSSTGPWMRPAGRWRHGSVLSPGPGAQSVTNGLFPASLRHSGVQPTLKPEQPSM